MSSVASTDSFLQLDEEEVPDSVKEIARQLYMRVRSEEYYRGRSTEEILAGILYNAYRIEGQPILISEISEKYEVTDAQVKQASKYLQQKLELKVPPSTPEQYVEKFVSEVDCENKSELSRVSKEIIQQNAQNSEQFNGTSPTSIAASAVYCAGLIVDGVSLTQEDVSDISETSTVTIRQLYKQQKDVYED